MILNNHRLICSVALFAALMYLYFDFMLGLLVRDKAYLLTTLGGIILVSLVLRILAVSIVPKLRSSKLEVVLSLFSIEAFVSVLLFCGYLFSSNSLFLNLFSAIASNWAVALLVIMTPYILFRNLIAMSRGHSSLTWTLSVSILSFGILVLLLNLLPSSSVSAQSFTSIAKTLASNSRSEVISGGYHLLSPSPVLTYPSFVFFSALLVYAALPSETTSAADLAKVFMPALLAVVLALAWIVLVVIHLPIFSMTIPSIIMGVSIWWLTRVRNKK